MDLVMDHNNDASPDFVTDVVLYGNDHPVAKIWENGALVETKYPEAPCFIVLRWKKESRCYGKTKNPVVIYSMVLMDGSETVFKAVTNSGLSVLMEKHDLCVGCTVVVREYEWIWMSSPSAVEFHGVMFIKNMGWNYPPEFSLESFPPVMLSPARPRKKVKPDPKDTIVRNSCYPRNIRMYQEVLNVCEKSAQLQFTYVMPHCPPKYRYDLPTSYPAPYQHYVSGDWIQCQPTQCDWVEWMTKLMPKDKVTDHWRLPTIGPADDSSEEEDDVRCDCVFKFEWKLRDCIVETMPPEKIDSVELFWTVKNRYTHIEMADNFADLEPKHKRWCFYWYYAVNIFQVKSDAVPLPSCLIQAIRKLFPNSGKERYTGFKSSLERAMAKS